MEESIFNFEVIKSQIFSFLSGTPFLVATGIFFAYLFLTGVVKRIKNSVVYLAQVVLGILHPLRMRRICLNGLLLVFMIASFSLYSGAQAKLEGNEGVFEAIIGGSLALGIWSVAMLTYHLAVEYLAAAKQDKKNSTIS